MTAVRLFLVGAILLSAASLLLWPIAAMTSPMLFDAPGSDSNILTVSVFWSILLYPLPIVFAGIAYWRRRKTITLSRLWVYTVICLMSPGWLLASFYLLEIVCQGSLSCQ